MSTPMGTPDPRQQEVAAKLALPRETRAGGADAGAMRLRSADWFSWLSAGVDAGGAQPLITRDEACILTNAGSAGRLRARGARHQGGISGHAARALLASPSTATGLEIGMAFTFNPGFDGLAIEDTFLLGAAGLENLTVRRRARPLWLETEQ